MLRLFLNLCLILFTFTVSAQELASYKDALFVYPDLLPGSEPPAYRIVDYREMRDINGRDAIPERKVRRGYVSLDFGQPRGERVYRDKGLTIPHIATGKRSEARLIVMYIHGQGGNRIQGVADYTFGGNFNRVQNLVARNDGLYLSPDVDDFGAKGATGIAKLAQNYLNASPGASLFIACGSMGGQICWQMANKAEIVPRLGGLILLGSMWDSGFLTSRAFKRRVPVFFGHGSRDTVFPIARQEAFFRSILNARSDYPARFVRFETGTHGTPIRMTDWRETLNWMLRQQRN